MMRPSRWALAAIVITLPLLAQAGVKRIGEPTVEFTAAGPAGMKIKGVTHELDVSSHDADVVVKVPLAGLKTGISLRDTHMRDKYLEVSKYPNAELSVPRGSLKLSDGGSSAGDARGTLSLHGKKQPVNFHYEAKRKGNVLHVVGAVHLNMNKFGIEVPSYLGVTVKPDVDVNVEFEAKDGG